MIEVVIDLETSVKNRGDTAVGGMAASPFHEDNKIVLAGEYTPHDKKCCINDGTIPMFFEWAKTEEVLLIGHNITFDLLYLMQRFPFSWQEVERNITIWDTQQGAYLLSGQEHLFASLDQCCAEIGFELKDDKIKQYWNDGFDTEDIPKEELTDYLIHDLKATAAVYRFQQHVLSHMPKLNTLAEIKMEDILMTTRMEYNGMRFDAVSAYRASKELEGELEELNSKAEYLAYSRMWPEGVEFNVKSVDHVSAVLFGGVVKHMTPMVQYDEYGEPIVYKSGARKGEAKTKMTEEEHYVPGYELRPDPEWCTKKRGVYSSADGVLKSLPKNVFVNILLEMREKSKAKATYFDGYSALVWPDKCIHPSINNAATGTGRQSCTKPNLQNVTRS